MADGRVGSGLRDYVVKVDESKTPTSFQITPSFLAGTQTRLFDDAVFSVSQPGGDNTSDIRAVQN